MKKYYYILILVIFSSANCYAEELCSKYRGFMEDSLRIPKVMNYKNITLVFTLIFTVSLK